MEWNGFIVSRKLFVPLLLFHYTCLSFWLDWWLFWEQYPGGIDTTHPEHKYIDAVTKDMLNTHWCHSEHRFECASKQSLWPCAFRDPISIQHAQPHTQTLTHTHTQIHAHKHTHTHKQTHTHTSTLTHDHSSRVSNSSLRQSRRKDNGNNGESFYYTEIKMFQAF